MSKAFSLFWHCKLFTCFHHCIGFLSHPYVSLHSEVHVPLFCCLSFHILPVFHSQRPLHTSISLFLFSLEYFICSNLLKSLLIFPPPTPISFLHSPSIPLCFFPYISLSPSPSLSLSFSRDTGLLMTSLRFVSQLALTAVDYLTISIRRRRHLRDSPALAVQPRCANTLWCHARRNINKQLHATACRPSRDRQTEWASPFCSKWCQSCLKYWWVVGSVGSCVWDLQIAVASSWAHLCCWAPCFLDNLTWWWTAKN